MERRIIDISFRHRLSHLSSSFTALPILDHIYKTKRQGDVVVLSAGHGGMALYTCLEKYEGHNAEELFEKHGIHPHRDIEHGIHVSSGSLGSAVCVGVGYALADRSRDVHVVLSDGECAEGSVWEALAFARVAKLWNFKVHVNINGYSAYDSIDSWNLVLRLKAFFWPVKIWFTKSPDVSFMKGLQAHYHVMSESDKDELLVYLNAEGFCADAVQGYGGRLKNFFTHCGSRLWNFGQNSNRLSHKGSQCRVE
jgi:transketolase